MELITLIGICSVALLVRHFLVAFTGYISKVRI